MNMKPKPKAKTIGKRKRGEKTYPPPLPACDGGRHRADLIVVMFDAHKLDISDELKMVIDTLKPHHDKMRYRVSVCAQGRDNVEAGG